MYLCMYTYIYIYIVYICIIHIYLCVFAYFWVCVYIYIYTDSHIYTANIPKLWAYEVMQAFYHHSHLLWKGRPRNRDPQADCGLRQCPRPLM